MFHLKDGKILISYWPATFKFICDLVPDPKCMLEFFLDKPTLSHTYISGGESPQILFIICLFHIY